MKRKLIIIVLSFICTIPAHAQIVPVRTVVSALGKDTLVGTTIWAFTIGEPVVETLSGSNILLTQGFHQPDGYAYTPYFPFVTNINIYPNPAKPKSTLSFYLKIDKPILNISIYGADGKLYQNQTLESYAGQTYHSLNPQIMAAGTYTVKITAGYDTYVGKYIVIN